MTDATIQTIDPHVHLWDLRNTPRQASPLAKMLGWNRPALHWVARRVFPKHALAFFGRPDHVLRDYLAGDYAADASARELAGFVHVEASWQGRGPMGPVAETRWLESLGIPKLLGIVGHADLTLGDAVNEVLAEHVAASPRFRGIRHTLSHHADKGVLNGCDTAGLCRDETWRRGYRQLAKHGLSFEATVYDEQLPELAALAHDFPDTKIVLAHAGTPVGYGGAFASVGVDAAARQAIGDRWRAGMQELAEYPNVYVKLSGLAMPCLGWNYHAGTPPSANEVANDLAPLVDFTIDTFGAERCMFASNFPVDKVSMSWATLYDAFNTAVVDRSEAERRALFHDTAVAAYRLEP